MKFTKIATKIKQCTALTNNDLLTIINAVMVRMFHRCKLAALKNTELKLTKQHSIVRILITGANGQLGNEFRQLALNNNNMYFEFTDVNELNITQSDELEAYFSGKHFDYLINCAAYTAVDKAEEEASLANLINVDACEMLALACKKHGICLIHISTDFVFDGKQTGAYSENDIANPLSVYGKSKYDGEKIIIENCNNSLIIRTSWLYSSYGNNFVKTIIKKGTETGKLKVVFDQIGSPTYAADLAEAIFYIVLHHKIEGHVLYHYANEGAVSWYDFAMAIVEIANINCTISPVRSWEYPAKAIRPANSLFDKTKIKNDFGIEIPYWRTSLEKCIKKLKK